MRNTNGQENRHGGQQQSKHAHENETEDAAEPPQAEVLEALFKAYDVRGRTNKNELTPRIMRSIGAAFALSVAEDGVMIGRDCRPTSEGLAAAFIEGVISQGKRVRNLGLTTTDALYYSTTRYEAAGAMITASHNPADYNGVKLCKAGGMPLSSKELMACRDEVVRLEPIQAARGKTENINIMPDYIEHLLSLTGDVGQFSRLKVAVDGSNGMAGLAVGQLFKRLPAKMSGLYLELDGTFPNHPADPSYEENMVDLIDLVRRESSDLGVIFDGDADRAVFVDDLGEPIPGSTTVALLSHWYLTKKQSAATIVHDSICSHMVPKIIRKYGGRAVRSRVGTPFIRQAILEAKADFGAETSGHCYFKDNHMIDSGLLTMLYMMNIRATSGEPLSVLRKKFEHQGDYAHRAFEVADTDEALQSVERAFTDQGHSDSFDLDFFDGLIVNWPDKWFSLRPSNTEPVIRLHAEAENAEELRELMQKVESIATRATESSPNA